MAEPSLTDAERDELTNIFHAAIALDEAVAPLRGGNQEDWHFYAEPCCALRELLDGVGALIDRVPPAIRKELESLATIIKGTRTECVFMRDSANFLASYDLRGVAWRGLRAMNAATPEYVNLYPWANDAEAPTAKFQQRARELLDWLESRLVASPQAGGRILPHSRLSQAAPLFSAFWWACKFRGLASELDAERQDELKHLWRLIGYDDPDGLATEFIVRNHDQILTHQAPLRFDTWEPTAVEALVGSLRLLAGGDKPAAPTNAGGQEFIARLLTGPDDMELTPRELALLEAHLAQPLSFSQMQREQQAGNPVAARQRGKLKLIRDFNRNLQTAAATPNAEAISAGDSGNGRVEKAEVSDEQAKADANANDASNLPRSERLAYFSYQFACLKAETALTDQAAHTWLDENGLPDADDGSQYKELAGYTLPQFATWSRQLREARKAMGDNKYTRRRGRTGRSIIEQRKL